MSIEWDGEGLPPVGCECEWLASGDHDWMRIRVLAYYEDEAWLLPLNGAQSFTVGNPDGFRPIRTEADRRRNEAVQILCNVLGNGIQCDEKTGYGKAWFKAYDAIAAGKIPGVRLNDDTGS